MKKYLHLLKRSKLFGGIEEEELLSLLKCLNAKKQDIPKGGYIFRVGEYLSNVALMLKGSAHIQRDDYWGNRTIINRIGVGEMFGEAYVAPQSGAFLNDVLALVDSTVIIFDVRKILTVCSSACRFHSMLVENLFYAISQKNRALVQKLGHISKRTTREKLISYLSEQAKNNNSSSFTVPFNRQQLADFLSVDRSAMSNELCKMRDEGLLEFEKNYFRLIAVRRTEE